VCILLVFLKYVYHDARLSESKVCCICGFREWPRECISVSCHCSIITTLHEAEVKFSDYVRL